jgi:hypothetical protein
MQLFKHALVSGINARLEKVGSVLWPNKKVASEVCYAVANRLPDPEFNNLTVDGVTKIASEIKSIHAQAEKRGMKTNKVYAVKEASERNLERHALEVAAECMRKAANEGSLTNVGENTPESAAQTDQLAKLDLENRSRMEYVLGVGKTQMPSGGEVGEQMRHPKAPSTSPETPNSAAKLSSFEQKLYALKSAALNNIIINGETPAIRASALKIANLKKANDTPDPAMDLSGMGMPAADGAQSADVDAVVDALLQSGVDPSQIDPNELLQGLLMAQEAPEQASVPNTGGTPAQAETGGKPALESNGDQDDKQASEYLSILNKIADGSLTDVGTNTPETAAKTDQVAKLDQENRSTKDYVEPQGHSELGANGEGAVGKLQDAPKAPAATNPDTTVSREAKTATLEEQEYVEAFKKVAQIYSPRLPSKMPKHEKIAHLKEILKLEPVKRNAYVSALNPSKK